MLKDVYTIVLTEKVKELRELDKSNYDDLVAHVVRGNLYHSPKSTAWCGSDKIFYIIDTLAIPLKPAFNQTIKATIEQCTDNNNNAISGEFNVTGILEIETIPFEQR